ncbi:MAG: glycosyltransferase family 4 protein [Thermoplasmata archaeon]|nr:glycosyltransferase family 4 protein [Thermoplasmata archaeon]
MGESLSLCINTQTPLVQILGKDGEGTNRASSGPAVRLSDLIEGTDYRLSPGGVTRMVAPLARRLRTEGVLDEVDWVALNPTGPRTIEVEGMTLHNVSLDAARMASYGQVKEAIWGAVHGLDGRIGDDDLLWTDQYSEYAYYNRVSAETIQKLDRELDFDAFYVHDFQQLAVGSMLDTPKPKIFRWHIPFDETMIPEEWRQWLAKYFNSYDVVVVSARKYLASLKAFGHTGKVKQLYPYVDPAEFSRPPAEEVAATLRAKGADDADELILVVGRMDPVKGQDRVITAFAEVAKEAPASRLMLVGNGSFSSSKGGPGLSKGQKWRHELEELVKRHALEGRVMFTGHVTQRELDCLYEAARFTVLPSIKEGFGLVVVESWLHRKPTIVTDRAGIAELVDDGRNGLLVDPDDTSKLSDRLRTLLLDDGEIGRRLGREGYKAAQKCTLDAAAPAEAKLLREVTGG